MINFSVFRLDPTGDGETDIPHSERTLYTLSHDMRGKKGDISTKFYNVLIMNHYFKCIDM